MYKRTAESREIQPADKKGSQDQDIDPLIPAEADLEDEYEIPSLDRSLLKDETISENSSPLKEKEDRSTYQHILKSKNKVNYSITLQKWKGHVTEIKESSFTAELQDLTNPGTKEIAKFDFDDISPDDKKLIGIGAVFYWSVGYRNENGQTIKESIIRFQRLVDWNESDFNKAADRASYLEKNLNIQ